MKHYLVLPRVFLCFVAVAVLNGCVLELLVLLPTGGEHTRETDTRGAWGVKTSKTWEPILPTIGLIRPRETTKGQVLAMLSIPEEKTSDDRFFLYRYEMQTYKIRRENETVVERIPIGRLGGARFLIWFDQADIVKRYRWHDCKPTGDRKCHYLNDMCQMIKGLQEKQLIAQYC